MPDNKDNPGNLTGTLTEIPATAGGLLRLKALIIAALNCTFRTRYFIQLSDGQNYQGTQEADVVCGPQGKTVTFKNLAIPGAPGGSSNVPFSGNGAPTAATLAAGNYVAAPTPSLYVDMTNKVLYACTTAGTAVSAVWSQIGSSNTPNTGGTYQGTWNPNTPYTRGQIVRVEQNYSEGGVNATLGVFGCVIPGVGTPVTTAPAAGVSIPQFPEPSGAFWQLISFPPQAVSDCTNTDVSVYVHASQVF